MPPRAAMTEEQQAEMLALLEEHAKEFPAPRTAGDMGSHDFMKRRDALLAALKPDPVKVLDYFFSVPALPGSSPYGEAQIAWQTLRAQLAARPAAADEAAIRDDEARLCAEALTSLDWQAERAAGMKVGMRFTDVYAAAIRAGRHRERKT